MKVLIVTANTPKGEELSSTLGSAGLEATLVASPSEGLAAAASAAPECVVFDAAGADVGQFRASLESRCPDGAVPVLPMRDSAERVLRAIRAVAAPPDPEEPVERTVLLVDDKDGTRRRVCAQIENDGWRVLEAEGSQQAALMLIDHAVDCLMVSSVLDGQISDGFVRSAVAIRKCHPHPYSILVVGSIDDSDSSESLMNAGADDVVSRTAGLQVLHRRLRIALNHRRLLRENRRLKERLAELSQPD